MEWIIKIGQFILSLSILVVLHELGHYIPAKLFGTRVEKFFLFFDYKFALYKKKIGETVWGIGWIPFGGYVKIAGMIDESMDKDQLLKPAEPWEYRSKPAWQRLIIIVGGVTVNVLLAISIYIGLLFFYGEKFIPTSKLNDGIWAVNKEVCEAIGIQTGDKILNVGGKTIESYNELNAEIIYSGGKSILIERQGQQIQLSVPQGIDQEILKGDVPMVVALREPFFVGGFNDTIPFGKECGLQPGDQIISLNGSTIKYFDEFSAGVKQFSGTDVKIGVKRDEQNMELNCHVSDGGFVGIIPAGLKPKELEKLGFYEFETKNYSFFEAIPAGIALTGETLGGYVKQFKLIFSREGVKHVGSLGTIMNLFPKTWDWEAFWRLTAFLSIILAFVNILPIPALDGGHAVFIIYELVSGKKPSEKFLERAQTVGMFLLLALMVFALGNDVFKAITGKLF